MPDYEKMYFALAAKAADATEKIEEAVEILTAAMQEGENAYADGESG